MAAGASSLEAYDCQKNRVTRRNATHWQIDEYYQGQLGLFLWLICLCVGGLCMVWLHVTVPPNPFASCLLCVTFKRKTHIYTQGTSRGSGSSGPNPGRHVLHSFMNLKCGWHTRMTCLQPHLSHFHSFINLNAGGIHTRLQSLPHTHTNTHTHTCNFKSGLPPPRPRPPGPDGVAPRRRRLGIRGRLPHAGLPR